MDKNPTSKYDLLYFTNSNTYKKKFEENKQIKPLNDAEDVKFYRKRITHLTKSLLKNETTTTSSIKAAFDNYIHLESYWLDGKNPNVQFNNFYLFWLLWSV